MITRIAETTSVDLTWIAGGFGTVVAAVGVAFVILVVAAVVSALTDSDTTAGGKLLWTLFVLWVPLLGAVTWFVVGKKGHLNRFLGIDKGKARHKIPESIGQHSDAVARKNGKLHPA